MHISHRPVTLIFVILVLIEVDLLADGGVLRYPKDILQQEILCTGGMGL